METEAQLLARQAEIQITRAMLDIEEREIITKRMLLARVVMPEVVEIPEA